MNAVAENRRMQRGFTLIELLVVITIIGILIVALVPVVKRAQTAAKETKCKAGFSQIEAGLAAYAQNHGGNYPGVATDVMAPYSDHALGDPTFTSSAAGSNQDAAPNRMVAGVIGGRGVYNAQAGDMYAQLRDAKNLPVAGNEDTLRYFDVLMHSGALQEYPDNPFVSTPGSGERARMSNVFRFAIDMNDFDGNAGFYPGVPDTDGIFNPAIYANKTNWAAESAGFEDPLDPSRAFHPGTPNMLVGINSSTPPETIDDDSNFGTGSSTVAGPERDDYFAPGDFAYVPILSSSVYPWGDAAATLEDETFKWGTAVTGYYFFGYGSPEHKSRDFEDAQREFLQTGIPGCGGSGVDTTYEATVLQLFEGAIYFSKK